MIQDKKQLDVSRTGIKEQVINEIIALAKEHDMKKVILFGSRARGDFHRASDIDLAVYGGDVTGFALDVEEYTSTLLAYEGSRVANTGSPREIIKAAYAVYDFIEEDIWLSMLKERNNMTHVYDGNEAKELVNKILDKYIPAFCYMKEEIENRYRDAFIDKK